MAEKEIARELAEKFVAGELTREQYNQMRETHELPPLPTKSTQPRKTTARDWVIGAFITVILVLIAIPNFKEAQVRSKISNMVADMRKTLIALDAYKLEHGAYPPCSADPALNVSGINQSTFRIQNDQGVLVGLTSPVSYLPRYIEDPYAPVPGATFAYWAPEGGERCIIWSAGPDRKYDLTQENVAGQTLESLTRLQYDPSNGMISGGDKIRYALKESPPYIGDESLRSTAWAPDRTKSKSP